MSRQRKPRLSTDARIEALEGAVRNLLELARRKDAEILRLREEMLRHSEWTVERVSEIYACLSGDAETPEPDRRPHLTVLDGGRA